MSSNTIIEPDRFRDAITRSFGNNFNVHNQQDAPEILLRLFDMFIEEQFLERATLNIGYRSVIKCNNCLTETSQTDDSLILVVPITAHTIQASINKVFAKEELYGANQFLCNQCNQLENASKQIHIREFPAFLFVQLVRFRNNLTKDCRTVYPNVRINLPIQANSSNGIPDYKLLGIISHKGPYGSGHYTATVFLNNDPYLCNDHQIYRINPNRINEQNIYVAVYRLN